MEKLKVVGISGSPRKKATDYAVKWALEYIQAHYSAQTTYFSLRGKTINFCLHCDYCLRKKKGCVHKDDMQDIYPELESAKLWILGSPVYHGNISAQLKAVLDRTRAMLSKNRKVLTNKLGLGIAVGGDRNGGQELTLQTMLNFFIINGMIPVGGGFFGANFGGTIWSQDKGAQGVQEDSEGLKSIKKTVDKGMQLLT